MVRYVMVTAVIASALTAFIMNAVKEFFKREKEKKIVSRVHCFTYSKKLYWAKRLDDGNTEFWAHSALVERESWYLGKWDGESIIECDGFYHRALPWDVQKGALRLFSETHQWKL